MDNQVPEAWKKKGWDFPFLAFTFLVWIVALVETFRNFPFALISALGSYIIFNAVSTVIYSREYRFLGRLFPGLIIWAVGLLLIKLGGMPGIRVFGFYMDLTIWSSLLGFTFWPGDRPIKGLGSPKR
tara:strand:+ start:459 stop:839 length:381 start_codon:yes stop_codon:yes gene_type:complete